MKVNTLIPNLAELGLMQAEQFVYLLLSEPFNYTEWRCATPCGSDSTKHKANKRKIIEKKMLILQVKISKRK